MGEADRTNSSKDYRLIWDKMAKKKNSETNASNTSRTRTQERKRAVIEALQKSLGIVTTACINAGVSRVQFYEWKKTDADFAKAVDDIEDVTLDFVEGKLLQNVKDNDTQSILFYLKTKGKRRGYTERTEVKVELPEVNDNRTNAEIAGIFAERMKLYGEEK